MSFESSDRRLGWQRLALTAGIVVAGAIAAVGFADWLVSVSSGRHAVVDFHIYYEAGAAVVSGDSIFPSPSDPVLEANRAYINPPLTALLSAPLSLLPLRVAESLVVAFLWAPVVQAVQTGNVTIPLALGAALAWRYRDAPHLGGLAAGTTLAAKLFLWPVVVWFAVTRRLRAAAMAIGSGLVILGLSWAVIRFEGVGDYPDLLERARVLTESGTHTVYALAVSQGVPPGSSRVLWALVGIALLGALVACARRDDETGAFVFAIGATLALAPFVWLHYFELLLVAVAVARPRLSAAWLAPLPMWLGANLADGAPMQTSIYLVSAATTVALAIWPRPDRPYEVGRRTITVTSSAR